MLKEAGRGTNPAIRIFKADWSVLIDNARWVYLSGRVLPKFSDFQIEYPVNGMARASVLFPDIKLGASRNLERRGRWLAVIDCPPKSYGMLAILTLSVATSNQEKERKRNLAVPRGMAKAERLLRTSGQANLVAAIDPERKRATLKPRQYLKKSKWMNTFSSNQGLQVCYSTLTI